MLIKHIIRYTPAILVPAVSAFGALFFYTRLLTPAQFGEYALLLNWTNLLTVLVFYWLHISLPRLLPQAAREHNAANLSTTGYIAFGILSLLMALIALLCTTFSSSPELQKIALLSIPLTLVRGLASMNLLLHRNAFDPLRYGMLECGQTIIGLLSGLVLVYCLHMGSDGAILGLIIGPTVAWAADFRTTKRATSGSFEFFLLKDMLVFGLPLIFSYGFAFILASSDRFFIEYFCGASAVGLYSAGYNLMERSLTVICMLAALPSYTLSVHRLEHESPDAAREQIYHGGVALFALAFPACAGLILIRESFAALAIGSAFRAEAITIMPWIGVGALLCSVATHYFNQAFNFAKKSFLLIAVQGPAALVSIVSNILLIPHFGIMGAAYSTVLSYAVLLALSIFLGRRAFYIPFPFRPALYICISVLAMSVTLLLLPPDNSLQGLITHVIIGGGVYGLGLLIFNVLNIRTHVRSVILSVTAYNRT